MKLRTASAIQLGDVTIRPEIERGYLRSLGAVSVGKLQLRNPATRFIPWFDTYQGDVFCRFRFLGRSRRGRRTILKTRAISDPDFPFRERRDSSGDLCFRDKSWDSAPLEADVDIVFEPVRARIDGRAFTGFKYWFEYRSRTTPIHRLIDRQSWELGGRLKDVTLCLRNWLTPPRMRIRKSRTYSTVGLEKWARLLPGNLWARWSLLPSFDMQYGRDGVLLGGFDRVSLIRTVVESAAGEDALRCQDLHLFEQTKSVRTNPKTIVWAPDRLDDVDALNLWTRMHDREQERACRQLGIKPEEPPAITLSQNHWVGFRFDRSYEHVIDVAGEFGADLVFIDPIWEHGQAFREELEALLPPAQQAGTTIGKFRHNNMCCTFDFEVARHHGGEKELKALCDRARVKGLKIISWMATHYHSFTALQNDPQLGHGSSGIFAAKESGRHPDTGYAADCWTVNLHAPIARKIKQQILGVCRRTGLAGFLWDSFSNLGWWQLDYSKGDLRPQFDKMAGLYADLANAGLYLQPEAIVTFSNHSCCGLHGGNVYAGDLLGYSYNTVISLHYSENGGEAVDHANRILRGEAPFSLLFGCFAHKRIPNFAFHDVPREQWNRQAAAQIKELFGVYKQVRGLMRKRTVLKRGAGVLWENDTRDKVLFSMKAQRWPGVAIDAATGTREQDGRLQSGRVYRVRG